MFIHFSETCYLNKKDYEHGEKRIIGCKNCSCADGIMKCDNIICPKLTCAENKQLVVTDECCRYCPGNTLLFNDAEFLLNLIS